MATWVDLSKELPGGSSSPARTTPVPFGGESDYMRMLREAQVLDHCTKTLASHLSRLLSSGNGFAYIYDSGCSGAPKDFGPDTSHHF